MPVATTPSRSWLEKDERRRLTVLLRHAAEEDVQLATFGRRLEGRADALPGYATSLFEITDADVIATSGKTHHLMARPTGNPADEVAGVAFRITPAELAAADTYEVSAYKRIAVRLKSGLGAFVYVGA